MHIDLDIESPLDGTVPAARNARANGEIVLDIPNASTLFEIPVSVRLQVTGAQIARSGQIRPYGEDLSETFLSFGFSIRHSSCRCIADDARVIASPEGGHGPIIDELVTLSTVFRAPPGESFAPGTFTIETGVGAFISLGRANLTVDTGHIGATADIQLLDVTLG